MKNNALLIILSVFFSLGGLITAEAADFNPPFPRTVFQRATKPSAGDWQYSYGTTCRIFSNRDLAIFTGGSGRDASADSCAREIKQLSPSTIVLGKKANALPSENSEGGEHPHQFLAFKYYRPKVTNITQDGDEITLRLNSQAGFNYDNGRRAYLGNTGTYFVYEKYPQSDYPTDTLIVKAGKMGELTIDEILEAPFLRNAHKIFDYVVNYDPEVSVETVYGRKHAWEYEIDSAYGEVPLALGNFDGTHYDAFRTTYALNSEGNQPERLLAKNIDFDNDGVRDLDEHGLQWINAYWHEGLVRRFEYERQKLAALKPNTPRRELILSVNTGGGPDLKLPEQVRLNGMVQEGFMRYAASWQKLFEDFLAWDERTLEQDIPNTAFFQNYVKERHRETGKNDFQKMRYGLTTALMVGAYYGMNFGDYYFISLWYDEFDTLLGWPVSPPIALEDHCNKPSGQPRMCVHARFFDNGVAIVNPTGIPQTVTDEDLRTAEGGYYHGPYYRLSGGQDPDFNDGRPFDSITLQGETGSSARQNTGDGIILFDRPTTSVSDILVGNDFNDDTSPGSAPVELSPEGAWTKERARHNEQGEDNPYYTQWVLSHRDKELEGYGHQYTEQSGATATFRPTIGVAGVYEVYEWHGWRGRSPADEEELSDVRVLVKHDAGEDNLVIDQTRDYGRWNHLGTYRFARGTDGFVMFTHPGGTGAMIADVVKFVYTGNFGHLKQPAEPPLGCAELGGTPCGAGEICDGGQFQNTADYGMRCCVGGTCDDPVSGDLNGDGEVNVLDLQIMVGMILGASPADPSADLDGSGEVDVLDLQTLVNEILE